MELLTQFLILFLYAVVLYFVYQNAWLRFDEIYQRREQKFNRRFQRQNQYISTLQSELAELRESVGVKQGEGEKKAPVSLNPLKNIEQRRVDQLKENEIVMVDGKPVRKNNAFK